MSESASSFDEKLAKLMEDGKKLVAEGKITAGHHVFAHISKLNPAYPNIGHALAVTLPNSLMIKFAGQFDNSNIEHTEQEIFEIFNKRPSVKLLIIDFEDIRALPHFAINFLQKLINTEKVTVKLINLQPKPLQMLKNLNFDNIIWNDKSCPICGESKKCAAKFSHIKKHEIILQDSSD